MASLRVAQILAAVAGDASGAMTLPQRLVDACAGALPISGAGIALMTDSGPAGTVAAPMPRPRSRLHLQARTPANGTGSGLIPVVEDHAAMHQATGIVSVQANVTLTEALVLLRARAFAADRSSSRCRATSSPGSCTSRMGAGRSTMSEAIGPGRPRGRTDAAHLRRIG